jgi:hypothetical protein
MEAEDEKAALEGRKLETLVAGGRKLEIGQGCSIGHSVTLSWISRPQPMVNKNCGERKVLR